MDENISITKMSEIMNISVSEISRAFNPDYKMNDEKRAYILSTCEKYGYVPNKMASRLSKKSIKIGVMVPNVVEYSSREIIRGIKEGHKRVFDYKVVLSLKTMGSNSDASTYCNAIQELVDENCDGLILSANDEPQIIEKINEVSNLGIPVAALGADLEKSDILFSCGSDTSTASYMAAQILGMMTLGTDKNVVLVTGDMKSNVHYNATKSFFSHANEFGLNIVELIDSLDEADTAYFEMADALDNNSVNGIYITTANSMSIVKLLVERGLERNVKIVATDYFDMMRNCIKNGIVDATIYQNLYHISRRAFLYMYQYLSERKMPPRTVLLPPQIIMKSNCDSYK